ncbi:UDP-3-O-acylglucosamine N-acyltransferase [Nymphon striatum]|nr:UDP-3-O-acylglucosamine N-acyltransferase [Nymphon striatum]
MSTYWNQLVLNVQNNTKGSLTWSGVQPLTNGTILSSQDVPVSAPDEPTDQAFVGRSSDRSLSGASGEAKWLTADGTVLQAVVGHGVTIGAGSRVAANCVIEAGVDLGERCRVEAGAFIGAGTRVGSDCTIGPSALVGTAPDAYVYDDDGMRAPLCCGIAVIGDGAHIGAGAHVQRGVEGATQIGAFTRLGALAVVGHDCWIGTGAIIGTQSGIAGHTHIGDDVAIGVQTGVSSGVTIGDRARIGPKSGVMGTVPPDAIWWGNPAQNKHDELRTAAWLRRKIRRRSVVQAGDPGNHPTENQTKAVAEHGTTTE